MKKSMKNYEFTAEREISELKLKLSYNRSKSLRHNFVSKISSGVNHGTNSFILVDNLFRFENVFNNNLT